MRGCPPPNPYVCFFIPRSPCMQACGRRALWTFGVFDVGTVVFSRLYSPAARKRFGHQHSRVHPATTTNAHVYFFHTPSSLRTSPRAAGHEKRHLAVSFVVVVGLNRAAADITARTNNDRVAEISSCGFSVSASVGCAAAELADIRSNGKRRTFVRKLSQFPPQ